MRRVLCGQKGKGKAAVGSGERLGRERAPGRRVRDFPQFLGPLLTMFKCRRKQRGKKVTNDGIMSVEHSV